MFDLDATCEAHVTDFCDEESLVTDKFDDEALVTDICDEESNNFEESDKFDDSSSNCTDCFLKKWLTRGGH